MPFDGKHERAFEARVALDQKMAFKIAVRRNVLLGHWAAARMALHGTAADEYVKGLVEEEAVATDPQPLVGRIMDDLLTRDVPISRQEINDRISRFTAKARAEIVRRALR